MRSSQRRTIEHEETPTLEDPIDNRVRQVVIVKDSAPRVERLVRGEDHRALLAVPIVDDMKQHVGRVGAVREIADFVDDEHAWMCVHRERIGEASVAKGCGQIINEFRGCDEARIEAVLNRSIRDRHREMRLAPSWSCRRG